MRSKIIKTTTISSAHMEYPGANMQQQEHPSPPTESALNYCSIPFWLLLLFKGAYMMKRDNNPFRPTSWKLYNEHKGISWSCEEWVFTFFKYVEF